MKTHKPPILIGIGIFEIVLSLTMILAFGNIAMIGFLGLGFMFIVMGITQLRQEKG